MVDVTNPGNLSIQEPDQSEKFSIAPETPQVRYSPEYTNTKAQRYNIALGQSSPGVPQIENSLIAEGSNKWDEILGANEQMSNLKIRQQLIQNIAASRAPGSVPTMQDFDLVQSLTDDELHRPDLRDILNRKYANDYTNFVLTYPGNVVSADGVRNPSGEMLDVGDSASRNVQKALNAQDEYERIRQLESGENLQGWDYASNRVRQVGDFIGSLVPGYSTLVQRGQRIVGEGSAIGPSESILMGNNLEDQISNLYAIRDPQKFAETLRAKIDELYNIDKSQAVYFAQAVMAFSRTDKLLGNVQTTLDIAGAASTALRVGDKIAGAVQVGREFRAGEDFARNASRAAPQDLPTEPGYATATGRDIVPFNEGTGTAGAAATPRPGGPGAGLITGQKLLPGPVSGTQQAESKIVSASMNDPTDISKTAGELGDHGTAVGSDLVSGIQTGDPTGLSTLQTTTVGRRLPPGIDPARPYEEVSDLSGAARNRATDAILRASADEALDLLRVDRLSQDQVIRAAQERIAQTKNLFPGISNHIIGNPTIIPAEMDRYSNLYKVEMQFGKRDGMLFPTPKAAENFANRVLTPKFSDWEVRQQGTGGYYVSLSRHLSEVDLIRQGGIETGLRAPDSAAHVILNKYIRPADYSLSDQMVRERGRAVNAQSKLTQLFEHSTRDLAILSPVERADIDSIWAYNRGRGEFSQTAGDFIQKSITATGKFPTQAMVQANEAYNRLYDIDYAFRDAFLVTGMAARGGEKVSIPLVRGGTKTEAAFDGKVVNDLPWNSKDPFWITIVDSMKEKEYFSKFMTADVQKRINDHLADGFQIVLDPSEAKYYIVKDFQRGKIVPGNLGWKGGGHHEYSNDWFIKFPDIRESMGGAVNKYVGDVSVMSVATKKDAQRIAKSFETARNMLINNDPQLVKYWADNLDEFMSLPEFQKGVISGKFNIKAPFVAVRKGQRSLNSVEPLQGTFRNLVDATQNEHNIFQSVTGKYMQEQAPVTMDVFRSEGNRLIKTTDEPLLRPSHALRSSMQNLMDVRVMQDLKDKMARDFIQEYGQYFDGVSQRQLENNPWYYVTNGTFVQSMDPKLRAIAENVRIRATQLMNTPSTGEVFRHAALSEVGDWVYGLGGPEARQWYNDNLLHTIKDPTVFMRKIGYQTTMGFGNPAQFLVQASEVAKISAISPVAAGKAIAKFFPFQAAMLTDNPAHLNHIANMFGAMIGNKQEFLELVQAYKASGYGIVGHDQGFISQSGFNAPSSKLGLVAKTLGKASVLPFETGEKLARKISFMTAYEEWKAASKPGAELTRRDQTWILQRARDLNNNMQLDSNAGYQEGWLGNVTQFQRYAVNTALQYWDGGLFSDGRKLTLEQKGRKFLLMSLLFGPLSAAGGATLFPWKEWAKDKMKENDYTIPSWMEPITDGLISSWVHGMSGTKYNFDSFADGGITALNDLLQGDKPLGELVTSMSGNKIFELATTSGSASLKIFADTMNLEKDGTYLKMTAADLLEPLRSITSVDKTIRAWQIMNTGTWVSKSGSRLMNDATFGQAMADLMANVKPDAINAAFTSSSAIKRIEAAQRAAMQEVRKNVYEAIQSQKQGDDATAMQYFARAKASAISNGLTNKQYNDAYNQGMDPDAFTERGEQAWQRFLTRNVGQQIKE